MITFTLVLVISLTASAKKNAAKDAAARAEIEAFNRELTAAHLRMDTAAILGMWTEDGVSLLPGMKALEGKQAITEFLNGIVAHMPGYKVTRQEDDFHGLVISGDWASEWADTFQVTQPPGDKPAIEVHGKMMLVLHREADGKWRVAREMWNQGARP